MTPLEHQTAEGASTNRAHLAGLTRDELMERVAAASAEAAQLRDQNDHLRSQAIGRITAQTLFTGMVPDSNALTIGLKGGAAGLLAEMLASQFQESQAVNYLELRFNSQEVLPDEAFVVTIQKVQGLTPAQKLAQAQARLAGLPARARDAARRTAAGERVDFETEFS